MCVLTLVGVGWILLVKGKLEISVIVRHRGGAKRGSGIVTGRDDGTVMRAGSTN